MCICLICCCTYTSVKDIKSSWTLWLQVFPAAEEGGTPRFFGDLSSEEKAKMLKDRLKKYTQKVGGTHFFAGRL